MYRMVANHIKITAFRRTPRARASLLFIVRLYTPSHGYIYDSTLIHSVDEYVQFLWAFEWKKNVLDSKKRLVFRHSTCFMSYGTYTHSLHKKSRDDDDDWQIKRVFNEKAYEK